LARRDSGVEIAARGRVERRRKKRSVSIMLVILFLIRAEEVCLGSRGAVSGDTKQ
jgi:hypothetical protein